jgi:hypothetical protein
MVGQQGFDLLTDFTVPATSLIQISGSGCGVAQIESRQKDLFFSHCCSPHL